MCNNMLLIIYSYLVCTSPSLSIFDKFFLRNEASYKKISIHIFLLILLVESPCIQLYHQLRTILRNKYIIQNMANNTENNIENEYSL